MSVGPIQNIPKGLLGLLQLKQFGNNPSTLSSEVQASYDLLQQYLQNNAVDTESLFPGQAPLTTAALVTGGLGVFPFNTVSAGNAVVPANQLWYVHAWSAGGTTTAAADTLTFCLATANNSGSGVQVLSPTYFDVVTARNRNLQIAARPGIWMQPGDKLLCIVQDISMSVSIILTARLRATVLPI